MGVLIAIVAIIVVVGILKGVISSNNQPDLDSSGNMRCKGCGNSSFTYRDNSDGSVTYTCNYCGKRWTRY